ncbi:protein phosphatase PHLPP-like protein isoform X2 [Sitophilus oryzae]|uniref:Protein phosphatase PHLPP-like protein isoform X2 n=1 Tax=Sitophilus oryzae TaxID=7048 RepID=A0A6J2X664_SITOR|nr:protein phosphatase PHLPP-like protein isoform X2 [Sitophilus oryzae]
MLTMPPRKPLRLSERRGILRRECDSIDLDSLEEEEVDNEETRNGMVQTNHLTLSVPNQVLENASTVKHLNLNNLCKNQDENIGNCFVDEIVLPGESLESFAELRVLSLRSNGIQNFPNSVLQLTTLVTLDISDNSLLTLPPEISKLYNLKELILDQNLLSVLPSTLWDLKFLTTLRVASNRLALPPDKSKENPEMRALILAESELNPENRRNSNSKNSNGLTTLNLRANRLKGHIILGNYTSLTQLDISENSIEILDLGSVENLQVLQCSRNNLSQLTLYGKHLVSVIAGNNRLKSFTTSQPPLHLSHFDISYNDLESLPDWLSGCSELRSLFASNNALTSLPDHLFCNEMPFLQTVQLAYNQLQSLPMIQRRLPIRELFLQNNSLSSLPENFFKFVSTIKVLNLSNNRLVDLPKPEDVLVLEKLLLTANCLIDKSLDKMTPYLRNIKTLHVAYNNLTSLPEACPNYWTELEELVVSGNKILQIPQHIDQLKHLTVLRVHSNLLQSIPKLSKLLKLRVLDLAHNQLDRVDLTSLIPPNLKFLDLSCNTKLYVDCHQFNTYRTQRPMSLVDVSGKNRTSLPLSPAPFCESDLTDYSWSVGFSETSGTKSKLHITQIRLPAFCNTEALFGLFDGENNNDNPVGVDKVLPRILLEERTVKETAHDYMKYTMLSTYRNLKSKGLKQGLNAIIVHVLKAKPSSEDFNGFSDNFKKYVMKIASIGDIRIVLGKSSGPVRLLPVKMRKQIRTNPTLQLTVPDPDVTEIYLDEQDEYMIIANKNLWDVITPENAIREVSLQRNVILAAKRLQDLAQSYGAEENLSIIVVKFNLIGSDVDLLMRELRQTIRKNKYRSDSTNSVCQPGCCCETLNNECINCLEKIPIPPPMMMGDDRSSPSGQSEHCCSDCNSSSKMFISQLTKQPENRIFRSVTPSIFDTVEVKASPERRSYRGVAKALKQRREEERNKEVDSDSALSEEQFKCWEYMLEQNTQMIFDKELNNLNKGKRSKSPFSIKTPSLSRSNPHLSTISDNNNNPPTGHFLSKQFGSSRSFNPALAKSNSRLALDNRKQLMGGPNAAYFGSLQRLMPYNLEYDFALMHERGLVDSMDLDRMQQYWGVATTEL